MSWRRQSASLGGAHHSSLERALVNYTQQISLASSSGPRSAIKPRRTKKADEVSCSPSSRRRRSIQPDSAVRLKSLPLMPSFGGRLSVCPSVVGRSTDRQTDRRASDSSAAHEFNKPRGGRESVFVYLLVFLYYDQDLRQDKFAPTDDDDDRSGPERKKLCQHSTLVRSVFISKHSS